MQQIFMDAPVTLENFGEDAYLAANPDVKAAVLERMCVSGRAHSEQIGGEKDGAFERTLASQK